MTSLAEGFARLSTGVKLLSIISLALVPLGLIALFASLQASRTADVQRRADLRVAVTESTRKLGTELASDVAAIGSAVDMLEAGDDAASVCARAQAILSARSVSPTPFALFGAASQPVCATRGQRMRRPSTIGFDVRPEAAVTDGLLEVRVRGRTGNTVGVMRYPAATLAEFARPAELPGAYGLTLTAGDAALPIVVGPDTVLLGHETYSAPVGTLGLKIDMDIDRVPFSATEALLTFLPLLMWAAAAAAAIGFLVVDRLLIRPLKQLRATVASYVPGQPFDLPVRTPALEIRELGLTFAQFGNAIAVHEASLAHALAVQTKATREVHHRVKNNLQVIASLISLHARGAPTPEASAAYAAIQRRVDALSIVHRNHYAELDANRGIEIKALIGELAANLRATAPAAAPMITVSAAPFHASQDSAVAVAFLLTELAELSMTIDPGATISIGVAATPDPAKGRLTIASAALRSDKDTNARHIGRYARVIEGLARQLRSPLDRDDATGSYAINFPIMGIDSAIK